MNNGHRTLEQIEFDMWKRAREIWQAKDLPIESFDPIVKLMMGACAVELKKIVDEIESSRSRVLHRLAQVMMPDELVGPVPASTILNLQTNEARILIGPEFQASCSKDGVDFVFSPTGNYEIINASVELSLLLLSNHLIDITEKALLDKRSIQQLSTLQSSVEPGVSTERTLLLAIDLDDQISDLRSLTFFFDWAKASPNERTEYSRLLASTQWFIDQVSLTTHVGPKRFETNISDTIDEFDVSKQLEAKVNNYYEPHFIAIDLPVDSKVQDLKCECPEVIRQLFAGQELPFQKEMLWIEVRFPASFPNVALSEQLSHCLLNCVPAVNRRLNTKRYLLYEQSLNVVPLETDEQFFSIHQVLDSSGNEFQNLQTLYDIENTERKYYLRHGGVKRIDPRRGIELVKQMQDVIRDESAAFAAVNPDEMLSDLNTLRQTLARLDKKTIESDSNLESMWYLVLNQSQKPDTSWDEITAEFWSTHGEAANNLSPGEINQLLSSEYGPAVSQIQNITTTTGGRDRLRDAEVVQAFRSQIMTRGRIVTAEDIRAVCFSELGGLINDVVVNQGITTGDKAEEGLIRTIDVELIPSHTTKLNDEEWMNICRKLQSLLESNSSATSPIIVTTSSF